MRYAPSVSSLTERFLARDERALARAISLVEAGTEAGGSLLQAVRKAGKETDERIGARIIGVTGAPGSGKSTLVDRLIGVARALNRRVAVVAVDPTSPYTGGAILGDRIRMTRWHQDPEVYIRSMATRGHLGGLAAATLQVVALLEAYGFDDVFIETVGVGQSEVDIVKVADSTLLVLTPGQGDSVQTVKAGVMEIADVFAVNKADHPGGGRLKRELAALLELGLKEEGWRPPILETVASKGEGAEELFEELGAHHAYLQSAGALEARRRARARFEVSALLTERMRRELESREETFVDAVLQGELSSAEAVRKLLAVMDKSSG